MEREYATLAVRFAGPVRATGISTWPLLFLTAVADEGNWSTEAGTTDRLSSGMPPAIVPTGVAAPVDRLSLCSTELPGLPASSNEA